MVVETFERRRDFRVYKYFWLTRPLGLGHEGMNTTPTQ